MRAHLARPDWAAAGRGDLRRALRDLAVLERRLVPDRVELGEPVVELRRALTILLQSRGDGGLRKAASLL